LDVEYFAELRPCCIISPQRLIFRPSGKRGFSTAGLPQGDVPIALLAFNIGVEVGQLAFIAAVLGVMQLAKQFRIPDIVEGRLRTVTAYGVGVVAAFWLVERLAVFWA
jgi:hypothetical protein